VIDAPHRLQLHASLDLFSSIPFLITANLGSNPSMSTVVWLDKEVVRRTIKAILASTAEDMSPQVERLREVSEGDWDLFVRALEDGSILVSAVVVSTTLSISRRESQWDHRTLTGNLRRSYVNLRFHIPALMHYLSYLYICTFSLILMSPA